MSESGPTGLYVYQPFGPVSHPDRGETGRLFGIGGLHMQATVQGLTREEADAVLAALSAETIRFSCYTCGKSVSSALPKDAVLRAAAFCPECIEQGKLKEIAND